MQIKTRMVLWMIVLVLTACSGRDYEKKLRIGIIQPSINHLPLTYALSLDPKMNAKVSLTRFNTGWEVQEALIGAKIDAAIMPFSYAYNAAAKGYPIRIASFLERETDAIVSKADCPQIKDLDGKKMGLLKASTVDLLARHLADSLGISFIPVFFRSPNEMIAALQRSELDAITIYEPLISKLDKRFRALHYFGSDYPNHPCCDIVVNTEELSPDKQRIFEDILELTRAGIDKLNSLEGIGYVMDNYGLSEEAAINALAHTGFALGLEESGKNFELMLMQRSVDQGYTDRLPGKEEIYLQ